MEKVLNEKALLINNGEELEKARDILIIKGHEGLLGYDSSFEKDDPVSSGYLHYDDGMFYLSKNTFDKEVINMYDFQMISQTIF